MACGECSNGQCTSCLPGYSLSRNNNGTSVCTVNCYYPCLTCSNNVCNSCFPGFYLNSGICTLEINCNPNCPFCPTASYRNSTNHCVRCPTNCGSCPNGICAICMYGYFLDTTASNTCQRCPSMCRSCYDNGTCYDCALTHVK